MFERLRRDHLCYFGPPAPLWECILARTVGPMPLLWQTPTPAASPKSPLPLSLTETDPFKVLLKYDHRKREMALPKEADAADPETSLGNRIMHAMASGRGTVSAPFAAEDLPIEVALLSDRHILVRGPDIDSEVRFVQELVTGWLQRRERWRRRVENDEGPLGQVVASLKEANPEGRTRGVYALRDGPHATTPGLRRIVDPNLGCGMHGNVFAVGPMSRSHLILAAEHGWTLVGCAGGGADTVGGVLVEDFEDMAQL